jgi:hypothetical protein
MPGTTRKEHQAERLVAIRLRYCINTYLDEQGITAPPDIARAVGLLQAEAVRLLTRRQWREGNVLPCAPSPTGSGSRSRWKGLICRPRRGAQRKLSPSPGAKGRRPGGAPGKGERAHSGYLRARALQCCSTLPRRSAPAVFQAGVR